MQNITPYFIATYTTFHINISKIKFNQNQFDALVSFSYNLGTSWMKNPDFYLRELILKSSNYNIKNIEEPTLEEIFNADKEARQLVYSKVKEV